MCVLLIVAVYLAVYAMLFYEACAHSNETGTVLRLTSVFEKRIKESFLRLSLPAGFAVPHYAYREGGWNSYYFAGTHTVVLAEYVLASCSDRIFDAIHAHELAHAYRHDVDLHRGHVSTDLLAAKFCSLSAMIDALRFLASKRWELKFRYFFPGLGSCDLAQRIKVLKTLEKTAA